MGFVVACHFAFTFFRFLSTMSSSSSSSSSSSLSLGPTSVRLSREEFRKAKELEELRKSGAAPPELDESGQMINPHIPQYISKAPWYLKQQAPGLKHQYSKNFASVLLPSSSSSSS